MTEQQANKGRMEYPVSSAQKRMFLLHQFHNTQTSYNLPFMIRIAGRIDRPKLQEAFRRLIQRHEILRTSFTVNQEQIVQLIQTDPDFELQFTKVPADRIDSISRAFIRPFDLSRAPLFRAELIEFSETEFMLLVDMHHSISDRISCIIFNRELVALYTGQALPEPKTQYKDFVFWENEFAGTTDFLTQESYWLNKFAGSLPVLELPLDFARPSRQTFNGATVNCSIAPDEAARLNQLALKNRVTLNAALIMVYGILLAKYTGQEDLIIGTTVNGRQHPDFRDTIGLFVNTLPLRLRVNPRLSVPELLKQIGEAVFEANQNLDYPFDRLIERLQISGDSSRNPLVDTMFVFLDNPEGDPVIDTGELQLTTTRLNQNMAPVDLMIIANYQKDGSLRYFWLYNTDLYQRETIHRMAGHFQNILRAILANPGQQIRQVEVLSREERQRILKEFNNTAVGYPKDKTIEQLFEEQALRTPDQTALIFEAQRMTYRELNQKANSLAYRLREKGLNRIRSWRSSSNVLSR